MNPEQNEKSELKQIRTFQGDIADALKRQQESLVSIQRAESIKSGNLSYRSESTGKTVRNTSLLVLGSFLLILLGSVGGWYAYREFVNKTRTPVIASLPNQFLSVNNTVNIDVTNPTREKIINAVSTNLTNIKDGEVRQVVLNRLNELGESVTISITEFLTALQTSAQGSLVRAFGPLYMTGALKSSNSDEVGTFLIINLSSFENAFAGMLLWEKTLAQDIGPLFTTAPLLVNVPTETAFVDITDRNKDIRALVLEEKPLLMYSFFDNEKLIITDNLETMRTLIDRLTREKLSR